MKVQRTHTDKSQSVRKTKFHSLSTQTRFGLVKQTANYNFTIFGCVIDFCRHIETLIISFTKGILEVLVSIRNVKPVLPARIPLTRLTLNRANVTPSADLGPGDRVMPQLTLYVSLTAPGQVSVAAFKPIVPLYGCSVQPLFSLSITCKMSLQLVNL